MTFIDFSLIFHRFFITFDHSSRLSPPRLEVWQLAREFPKQLLAWEALHGRWQLECQRLTAEHEAKKKEAKAGPMPLPPLSM